jgi:hypothetical protein
MTRYGFTVSTVIADPSDAKTRYRRLYPLKIHRLAKVETLPSQQQWLLVCSGLAAMALSSLQQGRAALLQAQLKQEAQSAAQSGTWGALQTTC